MPRQKGLYFHNRGRTGADGDPWTVGGFPRHVGLVEPGQCPPDGSFRLRGGLVGRLLDPLSGTVLGSTARFIGSAGSFVPSAHCSLLGGVNDAEALALAFAILVAAGGRRFLKSHEPHLV